MSNAIVALLGGSPEPLFIGIREIPTKEVVLIAEKSDRNADKLKKDLERFKIPVEIEKISKINFESVFEAVARIKMAHEKHGNVLINVSTADKMGSCIALSAAFVNGIKAFYIADNEVKFFPVLKFSYYNLIQESKMGILKFLDKTPTCCSSLEELSRRTGMSLPLISYHINGNAASDGLVEMGLVEAEKKEGRIEVKLTTLGKLLVRGCI